MLCDSLLPYMQNHGAEDLNPASHRSRARAPLNNGRVGRVRGDRFPASRAFLPNTSATDARSRSSSIPLPSSHVARTQSELQLSLDQEVAEQRDIDMFYRLVNGIRDRQVDQMSHSEQSIASIMLTRHRNLGHHTPSLHDVVSPENATAYHWLQASSSQAQVETLEEDADEWSISGFDAPVFIASQATTHVARPTQGPLVCDHGALEEDDEIFDMEL